MQKSIITNNFGFLFPTPIVLVGFCFIAAGIVSILTGQLAGIVICFVGGLIALTFNGARIDTANKRFKLYSQWFGFRSGKWKSMEHFPYLAVINLQSGYRMASRSNRTVDIPDTTYSVCLLSESHRQKVVIATAPTRSLALSIAQELAPSLEKEIVQYSPVISAQTRARR